MVPKKKSEPCCEPSCEKNALNAADSQQLKSTQRLDCIPILHVRGTHYAVGRAIGKTFKGMIKDLIESWPYFDTLWKSFLQEDGRFLYEKSLQHCQNKFPNYIEEIKGMAEGSEVQFEKLFLLNIDSIISDKDETIAMRSATGCTSIICNKEEVLLGHTEDAMCEILNNVYIVSAEIVDDGGILLEKFTTFSYAGHLMGYTMGWNSHGMVYSVNTLFPSSIYKNGTPRSFIARKILGSQNLSCLLDVLKDAGTGISDGMSLNVHFAKDKNPRMFYNIEVLPHSSSSSLHDGGSAAESLLNILPIGAGESSVHCNKYLRFSTKEQSMAVAVSTNRQVAIEKHSKLEGLSDIKFLLSDQSNESFPVYICDEITTNKLSHVKTVAVGVFNLLEKTWAIYLGKPSQSDPVAVLPLNF